MKVYDSKKVNESNTTNNQTLLGNNDIIDSVKYQVSSVAQV
jgi:hypothetical protein